MLQSARTDAVRALLVLLHLLEAKTERIGQLLLADAEHHPPHAHPAANVHVNGVWSLDGGHWLSPSTKELLCRNAPAFGDPLCAPVIIVVIDWFHNSFRTLLCFVSSS